MNLIVISFYFSFWRNKEKGSQKFFKIVNCMSFNTSWSAGSLEGEELVEIRGTCVHC